MASIVLTAAAVAAVPTGASPFLLALAGGAGGFIGGYIDRAIFGGSTKLHQEGSRLTDLSVQVSTYGKAIPIAYGLARLAGNVIWAQTIQEHVSTSTQSSGGRRT